MHWRIKGVYLDPQPLPFVSSWFVPNPAKADYACIKFPKIAVFVIPHLQQRKANGSSLQSENLPNRVPAACVELHEQCKWKQCFFHRNIVTLMIFLRKHKNKFPGKIPPTCACMWLCAIDWTLWPKRWLRKTKRFFFFSDQINIISLRYFPHIFFFLLLTHFSILWKKKPQVD